MTCLPQSLIQVTLTTQEYNIKICNIYTFQRDTHCCSTDCLLMHRCELYMFQTVTVHPQELLFRCCMCRLWYVLIHPAGTTFEEELLPQMLYQWDVSGSAFLATYHSLHIQHLKRSSRMDRYGPKHVELTRVLINNQCNYNVYLVGMYIYYTYHNF